MNLINLLKHLDYERLTGTEGEAKAIAFITEYLTNLGLSSEIESFDLHGFESGTASIKHPSIKPIEATPYGLCNKVKIKGELCFLENADILYQNPGMFSDKIVLYYHSTKRLYELAEKSDVKAFIGISSPQKGAYSYSHRQKRAEEKIIPTVMITYDDAERLIRLDGQQVELSIIQKAEPKIGHNIVCDIAGRGLDDNLILAVGHYDTVARSHGAVDNGGGTVCLLKLAEYFSKNQPLRNIRIIFFSGEELGLLGSYAYVKVHEDELLKRCRLVINIDLAGDPIGKNVVFVLGSKELLGYTDGVLRENGLLFEKNLSTYSSDCMPFSVLEIPAINLARFAGKGLFFCHTADDNVKNAHERGLYPVYSAAETLLKHITNATIFPIDKAIDESLREKIEAYLYQSTLEKPDLKWVEKYKR